MAGSRRRYPPEYREEMVERVRSGLSTRSLAREFEPSEQMICNWVKQGGQLSVPPPTSAR